MKTEILLQKIDIRSGSRFKRMKKGDVGFDLEVWSKESDSVFLKAQSFTNVPTGLRIKVGDNSWGMITSRSSTFIKRKLIVMQGTIDCGYTGDLFVTVYNPNENWVQLHNGESIAQLIPIPMFIDVKVTIVEEMPETERGSTGFGSTGAIKL